MNAIPAKQLIEFAGKPAGEQRYFLERIRSSVTGRRKHPGNDYWSAALNAVGRAFREQDGRQVDDMLFILREKARTATQPILVDMYQNNMALLQTYQTLDPRRLCPASGIEAMAQPARTPSLVIHGLSIEVSPSLVFSHRQGGVNGIGAVWFVARRPAYSSEEIGLFCELLYRYLQHRRGKRQQVLPEYCIVVDLASGAVIDYRSISNSGSRERLDALLETIVGFLQPT